MGFRPYHVGLPGLPDGRIMPAKSLEGNLKMGFPVAGVALHRGMGV